MALARNADAGGAGALLLMARAAQALRVPSLAWHGVRAPLLFDLSRCSGSVDAMRAVVLVCDGTVGWFMNSGSVHTPHAHLLAVRAGARACNRSCGAL